MSHPRIEISGNLVATPDLKFTPDGTAVLRFSVATNDYRRNPETGTWETRGQAHFWDCEVWRDQAEVIAALDWPKGTPLTVVGTLRHERWEKDGVSHTTVRVSAQRVTLDVVTLERRKRSSNASGPAGRPDMDERGSEPIAHDPWAQIDERFQHRSTPNEMER